MKKTNNIQIIANNIYELRNLGINEECTKIYMVLPFIQHLGYDIYSPADIIPEYKPKYYTGNDRVDFALCEDYTPKIYIEVKKLSDKEALSQKNIDWLAKYFNSDPNIKLGILTNGESYLFFTDHEHENIMDREPFYRYNAVRSTIVDDYLLDYFSKNCYNNQSIDNCILTISNMQRLRDGFVSILNNKKYYLELLEEGKEAIVNKIYEQNNIDEDYLAREFAIKLLPI